MEETKKLPQKWINTPFSFTRLSKNLSLLQQAVLVKVSEQLQPFIKELAEKYKGRGKVFNFSERYSTASTFNQNLNKGLKDVGEAVGIEGLNFYQARHTFATLSRNLMRFSKSDVDEALNHVGTMDIADVYIAKDFSIINENNAKLIKKVFKQKSPATSEATEDK